MKTTSKFLIAILLTLSFSYIKAQNGILKAVMDGDYDRVEQLISSEPKMVDTMIMDNTPLIVAAYFGKDKIVLSHSVSSELKKF